MRPSLGTALIISGVAAGVIGAAAVTLGVYTDLPPVVLKVAAYKFVAISALCIIAAGAVVRRAEQRLRERLPPPDPPRGELPLPRPDAFDAARRPEARAARADRQPPSTNR
jgi:hypothetical protein